MTRWRVAVTRDEPEDGALSQALCRYGFIARHCPVFAAQAPRDQAPLLEAAAALEAFDFVVFSSARAVHAITRARSTPWPAGLRTAAVGLQTAGAIARMGVTTPAIVGDRDGAAALWAVLAADHWQGRRVLLPAAAEGLSLIANHLRAAGAIVEEIVAYRMVPRPSRDVEASWTVASPDAVVIASPAVVHRLVAALGVERLRRLSAVAAIGPTTSAALTTVRITHHVSPRAHFEAVSQLLRTLYRP